MRPDQRWFPTSRTERAAWFQNFARQFTVVGAALGFTQAEIDSVNADNAMVQFLNGTMLATDSYTAAVTSFQQTLLLGKFGAVRPDFPVLLAPPTPAIPAAGVFERLERLVRRIRLAPAYNSDAGALLGIIPRLGRRPELNSVVPSFKLLPSSDPFSFQVKVVKRGFAAFTVQMLRQSSDKWEDGGFFAHSPAAITVKPLTPEMPEVIRVRVRMAKGNDPVGQYSDMQAVTVTP